MMGGRIWVASNLNEGSAFHFTARFGLASQSDIAPMPSSEGGQRQADANPAMEAAPVRLRVLMAEDNRINQVLGVTLLEEWGHEVVVANDGQEALAALQREQFDVVLMDVQMPRMDGVEATQAIRDKEKSTGAHIPIVAMTANAMSGDRERFLESGMDEYIAKPLQTEKLLEVINKMASDALACQEQSGAAEQSRSDSFDIAAALESFSGNEELLTRMAGVFIGAAPNYLLALREAIAERDCGKLNMAAHSLKGAIGIFTEGDTLELAQSLENMGRSGSLASAEEAYASLENEVERLSWQLRALVENADSERGEHNPVLRKA